MRLSFSPQQIFFIFFFIFCSSHVSGLWNLTFIILNFIAIFLMSRMEQRFKETSLKWWRCYKNGIECCLDSDPWHIIIKRVCVLCQWEETLHSTEQTDNINPCMNHKSTQQTLFNLWNAILTITQSYMCGNLPNILVSQE